MDSLGTLSLINNECFIWYFFNSIIDLNVTFDFYSKLIYHRSHKDNIFILKDWIALTF